jgi:glucoamylase
MEAMARMASPGGMLPEQVWDAAPIPRRGLRLGAATGSAMPLAWTHAEYLKLVASRALGRPFDRPDAVWRRYHGERCRSLRAIWCEHAQIAEIGAGSSIILALREAASVHFGFNGWQGVKDEATTPNSLGVHLLRIDTSGLKAGQSVDFTFRYLSAEQWVGSDYHIAVN